jgi:hypothetical protein
MEAALATGQGGQDCAAGHEAGRANTASRCELLPDPEPASRKGPAQKESRNRDCAGHWVYFR